MADYIELTPEQVARAADIVTCLGWESSTLTEAVETLGLKVSLPRNPCWRDIARAGLTYAAVQVAVHLQDSPEGLQWLDLGGGTLPDGTVLPEGLRWLDR